MLKLTTPIYKVAEKNCRVDVKAELNWLMVLLFSTCQAVVVWILIILCFIVGLCSYVLAMLYGSHGNKGICIESCFNVCLDSVSI